ncbi:hypothetical protein ACDA55_37815, partial [Rhizobium ruizarguesonis]
MSLTSYRVAPPRVIILHQKGPLARPFLFGMGRRVSDEKIVLQKLRFADLAATYSPASEDEVPWAQGRFTAVVG